MYSKPKYTFDQIYKSIDSEIIAREIRDQITDNAVDMAHLYDQAQLLACTSLEFYSPNFV